MVDFALTEEQQALREMARKFAATEIWPKSAEYDRSHEFPQPILEKAFDLGLVGVNIPDAYGGPGLSLVDECIVGEEMGWGCSGIATSMNINSLAAWPLLLAGNEAQKTKYLPRLAREKKYAAYCLTEPSAGSDVLGIQTTAQRTPDGYVLNGVKQFITSGTYADFYAVFAYTDRTAKHKGMSCFVVERASKGVSIGKREDKMGQHASDTVSVIFEDVHVPAENLLGKEGDGFKIAMQVFDRSRPSVSSMAVGVARRAMECAADYAMTRTAFSVPLANQQAIAFMIADMAIQIDAARLLVWQAAWMCDRGMKSAREAAFAKAFAADTCMRVTTDAVQVYGGYGYSREYPVEKLMRDAKVFQIYEGTSQIQRVIIAREMFRGK